MIQDRKRGEAVSWPPTAVGLQTAHVTALLGSSKPGHSEGVRREGQQLFAASHPTRGCPCTSHPARGCPCASTSSPGQPPRRGPWLQVWLV